MNKHIQNKTKLAIFTLVLLLSTTLLLVSINQAQTIQNNTDNQLNYTTGVPLIITNDSDLSGNASSGDGSSSLPYIIEGLNITTLDSYAIYVEGTTSNFTIRDCYLVAFSNPIQIDNVLANTVSISNNILSSGSHGIRIRDTDYVNVTDNICQDNSDGIYLENADYIYLENNTCFGGANGIYTYSCDYLTLFNNKFHSNTQDGVYISSNSNFPNITNNKCFSNNQNGLLVDNSILGTIIQNECYSNDNNGIRVRAGTWNTIELNNVHDNQKNGIKIGQTDGNTIVNNTVQNNGWYGIFNDHATSTTILDNDATNDGFGIFESNQFAYSGLSVGGNTVNGKPLGYINGLGEATIASGIYGQLILLFCDGTIVKDETIADTSVALTMDGCNNVTVDNCNFENNNYGSIRVDSSTNTTIKNTSCSYNDNFGGILGYGANDISFLNVTANNNPFGIWMNGATVFNVSQCIFDQNTWYNVRFQDSVAGNIKDNAITSSVDRGLIFNNCDYTNVSHNWFKNNFGYAITLDSVSDGNWIHHNAFINNNNGQTQASDNSMTNLWDDPWNMEGNYWDNHLGTGNYTLDGLAKANDSYPLGDIPPGVFEYSNLSYIILLVPIVFWSLMIIRKRKR